MPACGGENGGGGFVGEVGQTVGMSRRCGCASTLEPNFWQTGSLAGQFYPHPPASSNHDILFNRSSPQELIPRFVPLCSRSSASDSHIVYLEGAGVYPCKPLTRRRLAVSHDFSNNPRSAIRNIERCLRIMRIIHLAQPQSKSYRTCSNHLSVVYTSLSSWVSHEIDKRKMRVACVCGGLVHLLPKPDYAVVLI